MCGTAARLFATVADVILPPSMAAHASVGGSGYCLRPRWSLPVAFLVRNAGAHPPGDKSNAIRDGRADRENWTAAGQSLLNPRNNAEIAMPRASWKGFLRLSLVSCPVYLSPATTRTKSIRLNQVWVPRARAHEPIDDDDEEEEQPVRPGRGLQQPQPEPEEPVATGPATRIALRPHDPYSGQEIERDEVRKGYEYDRGQFVTFTTDELKALDIESSKTIDLGAFVLRADVDPFYFSTPYFVYPDGPVAIEPYRVISAAMSAAGMAGLGRLTLSRRERMVLVEPRGSGLSLVTLRSTEEVRAADFRQYDDELDEEAVAIAAMIIKRKTGTFDPSTFRDRYQDVLRELIEGKDARLAGQGPS
jgi:DNA end-binding protein Ku